MDHSNNAMINVANPDDRGRTDLSAQSSLDVSAVTIRDGGR